MSTQPGGPTPRRKPRHRSRPAQRTVTDSATAAPEASVRPDEPDGPPEADPPPAAARTRRQRPAAARGDHSERQWRELAGSGHSQVSLDAALRARDADRPTPAELADAERNTIVQHRNWTPSG